MLICILGAPFAPLGLVPKNYAHNMLIHKVICILWKSILSVVMSSLRTFTHSMQHILRSLTKSYVIHLKRKLLILHFIK